MNRKYTNKYDISSSPFQEAIDKIERLGGKYDPDSALPIDEQLFICEALTQQSPELNIINKENANDKWNVNGTYKRPANESLYKTKQEAIKKLRTFTYKSPPIEIARTLEILFVNYPSKDGHWLFIAQNWNPRAINRVINNMIKIHQYGKSTIKNPSAYFTILINFRKKRRSI